MNGDNSSPINALDTHGVYVKGNMESITTMIPIDISKTPSVMENVFIKANFSLEEIRTYTELFKELYDIFSWSYGEMPCIDP